MRLPSQPPSSNPPFQGGPRCPSAAHRIPLPQQTLPSRASPRPRIPPRTSPPNPRPPHHPIKLVPPHPLPHPGPPGRLENHILEHLLAHVVRPQQRRHTLQVRQRDRLAPRKQRKRLVHLGLVRRVRRRLARLQLERADADEGRVRREAFVVGVEDRDEVGEFGFGGGGDAEGAGGGGWLVVGRVWGGGVGDVH